MSHPECGRPNGHVCQELSGHACLELGCIEPAGTRWTADEIAGVIPKGEI